MSADVTINLELITAAFKSAISDATKTSQDFADKSKSHFGSIQGAFTVMSGEIAAHALESIFEGISEALHSVVEKAAESEQSITNLNIALKSAGIYTSESSESLIAYAEQIQNTTKYSKEAALESATLLINLTNLNEKGIKKATQAALDLSATLNIPLQEATSMIEKAINGNVLAFARKGIAIKAAETEAGRLTNTLKALQSQSGTSETSANTYAGAVEKSKNQLNELLVSIGKIIIENPSVINAISGLADTFKSMGEWVNQNKVFINDLITTMKIMGVGLGLLATGFGIMSISAAAAWAIVLSPITAIVIAITMVGAAIYEVVKYWDDIKVGAYNAAAATMEYAAAAVSVFSPDKAKEMQDQANAWKASAENIKTTSEATKSLTEANKTASAEGSAEAKQEAANALARANRMKEENTRIATDHAVKAANKRTHNAEMTNIEKEGLLQIDDLKNTDQLAQVEAHAVWDIKEITDLQAHHMQILQEQQTQARVLLELQVQTDINKTLLETDEKKRRDAQNVINDKAEIDRAKLNNKDQLDLAKQASEDKKKLDADSLAARTNTLNLFASLQTSSNQNMASIGKAAGLVQIAIATPTAVAQAFTFGTASGGPILGGVFAGIAAAAMAAQAAQLVGVKFADGGIVPGNSFGGDKVQARLNSGEMILNNSQQAKLFQMANNGGGSSSKVEALLGSLIDAVKNQSQSIQVDGREIINVVRTGLQSGRTI